MLLSAACSPKHTPEISSRETGMLRTTLTTEGAALTLRVDNIGDESARFCRYQTPFEGILSPFLKVEDANGDEAVYRGIMVKRAPPDAHDYRTLRAGSSKVVTFEWVDSWAVDSGTYTVQFHGGRVSGLPDSGPITVVLE